MNKFLAFAVLAVAAIAVSVSSTPVPEETMTEAILNTTDDEETTQLEAKNLLAFSDFCISSRDYVLADIKRETGELSSNVFGLFFSFAEAVGKESLDVQRSATQKLKQQLANPESPIEGATDAADEIIANGQQEIQGQSQPRALLTAFKAAISAVSSKVGSLVTDRFNYLKSLASPAQLVNAISAGCNKVENYEKEIRDQFEEYKRSSLGDAAEKYAHLSLDSVPCATAQKIIRSDGLCKLAGAVKAPISKILATRA